MRRTIPAAPIAAAIRDALRAIDPDQAVGGASTLEDQVASVTLTERFSALLVGALSVIGLFLATCGLYGVVSYSVSQRTGELGLRMALGAAPGDVRRMVARDGAVLTAVGIGAGLAGARALAAWLASTLYEVNAGDLATFAAVAALLAAVALIACYVPARRAADADPTIALRAE